MAKCPFFSEKLDDAVDCAEADCQLWVEYCNIRNSGGAGQCALTLLAIMALPNFGAYPKP